MSFIKKNVEIKKKRSKSKIESNIKSFYEIEKYHAICIRQIDIIVEMNDNRMTCL